MKNPFILIFLSCILMVNINDAQTHKTEATTSTELEKEIFTVYGNCNMCKRAIEGNVVLLAGIHKATWNKTTHKMTVSFDPKLITLDAIKQKIADVGYDSDTHKAKDEAYNNLPGCCQYDRPEIKVD